MKYNNILEEELKNKVAQDFFERHDCTDIKGFIDFAVKLKRQKGSIDFADEYLLWAEAKQKPTDILVMLTQLVLTIGKARTFDRHLPPPFLGCFDCEKIAFVPYSDIQDIFYQNDFNWNVTPSNHETKEFQQVYGQIKKVVENDIPWETYLFDFEKDEKDLHRFIRENFIVGKGDATKIKIDKNNFIIIYNKWLEAVKPTIAVDWDFVKKNGIIDGDFYLADLLSSPPTPLHTGEGSSSTLNFHQTEERNNAPKLPHPSMERGQGEEEYFTIKEKLFILLKSNYYEANRRIDENGMFASSRVEFTDNQKAHTQFWAKYERPPLEEYWDYIIERRDLLVPQDVRERKGSFFTPRIWVELSQKYIADVFGEDWQDEYYVWDCAAGTGNLLAGLTNKYNIWASTLDKQDVDVMHDRIKNGANLLESHVFQFDFLNDEFSRLPQGLQDIVNDPEKRKKLIIYINPPYAEASNAKTQRDTGENRIGLANSYTYDKYQSIVGTATRELFVQFLIRIYCEIPTAKIANFSTLKNLQSSNFSDFRKQFRAKLDKLFLVPAKSFDNVKGKFPIGFFIWNTEIKETFEQISADIYDINANFIGTKYIYSYKNCKYIIDWLRNYYDKKGERVAYLRMLGTDMQHNKDIFISNDLSENDFKKRLYTIITKNNVIEMSIYLAVRKVIPADWLNDRDQFLYPNDGWKADLEFQNDCLAYTLFNNNIQSKYGVNHWIPFTEKEVGAQDKFSSNFMTDFIAGKIKANKPTDLFSQIFFSSPPTPLHTGEGSSSTLNFHQTEERNNAPKFPHSSMERGQGGEEKTRTVETQIPPQLLANARELRKTQTDAEELLWHLLRNKNLNGLKFRRQHPLKAGFILDFYCAEIKLGIEIDGAYHNQIEQKEYDAERTSVINGYGIKIIRFTNDEVITDIENVLGRILSSPPTPLHNGEGSSPSLNLCQNGEESNSHPSDTPLHNGEGSSPSLNLYQNGEESNSHPSDTPLHNGEGPGERKTFSLSAQAVFDAGRELWRYYHAQPKCNVNVSFYDIREYFQERNDAGKMNNTSDDEQYTELIGVLRNKLKVLAKAIEPKIYEYGFLKK